MTSRQAYIHTAATNNSVFNTVLQDDLLIYTQNSNQSIHLGTYSNASTKPAIDVSYSNNSNLTLITGNVQLDATSTLSNAGTSFLASLSNTNMNVSGTATVTTLSNTGNASINYLSNVTLSNGVISTSNLTLLTGSSNARFALETANNATFSNTLIGDLCISSATSNQSIHLGTNRSTLSNPALDITFASGCNLSIFNGRVGVNVTNPTQTLQINGTLSNNSTAWHGATNVSSLSSSGTVSTTGKFVAGVGWDHISIDHDGNLAQISAGGADNGLAFRVGTSATGDHTTATYTEMMRILSNGRVGIGTTTPECTLDVATTVPITYPGASTYEYLFGTQASYGHNGKTFNVSIRSGGSILTSSVYMVSDRRHKTNIKEIPNDVLKLKPVQYNYIDPYTGYGDTFGFIAQEVEEVYPNIVKERPTYIPNIFSFSKTVNGNTISMNEPHDLQPGNKLKLVIDSKTIETNVTHITDEYTFNVETNIGYNQKVFVYGKEIPDGKNVDFNQITALLVNTVQLQEKRIENLERLYADIVQRLNQYSIS